MPMYQQRTFTRKLLTADLREAGIVEGEVLLIHSSMRQIGWVSGGPRELIQAIQEVIGPRGTLLMPAFTFNMCGWDLPPFDPWRTASRVGLLTEAFRRMAGVWRTPHPTHSVAAWGALAGEMTEGPIDYEPLGIGSPLDRARRAGAKILLAGVGNDRNSTVHLAESIAGMPYLRIPFTQDADHDTAWYYRERRGKPLLLEIRETPGSSECFSSLDNLLPPLGVARRVRLGEAETMVMSSAALCDTVVDLLRRDPLLLLRGESPTAITARRREYMERQIPGSPVYS